MTEWVHKKLGDCLTIGNGCDYKHLQPGDVPVYGTGGVMTYVDKYLYDGETVCIGRKGTINHPIYHNGKIWTVDTLFYTHSFLNVLPKFIYYTFCNINWDKYNEATGVPSLSKETINKIEITVPPLPAQRRIAAILASADKVIAATQKTIAKYKQIKQGMMEDLLKPKEGWKMVKLGEVGEIVTGLTYSPSNVCQEGVLVLRSSNIQDDNLYFEDNVYVDVESFNPVIENDILICVRNGSRALIGKTARITKEVEGCAFGAFMLVYRSNYNDFLYHFFKSDMFFSQVSRNIGATINSINGSDLKNMDVYMPSDIIEQHRIASILSGIDAKIAAEEKVLEKYEKVKKGLMERLFSSNLTMNTNKKHK